MCIPNYIYTYSISIYAHDAYVNGQIALSSVCDSARSLWKADELVASAQQSWQQENKRIQKHSHESYVQCSHNLPHHSFDNIIFCAFSFGWVGVCRCWQSAFAHFAQTKAEIEYSQILFRFFGVCECVYNDMEHFIGSFWVCMNRCRCFVKKCNQYHADWNYVLRTCIGNQNIVSTIY